MAILEVTHYCLHRSQPTRAGVIILSIFNLLTASTVASAFANHPNSKLIQQLLLCEKIATVLISTAGFIGAAYTDRRLITFYSRALWVVFGLYLFIDTIKAVQSFPTRPDFESSCRSKMSEIVNRPEDKSEAEWQEDIKALCQVAYNPMIVGLSSMLACVKVIEFWTCMVVYRYRLQLDEQAREDEGVDLTPIPGAAARRTLRGTLFRAPTLSAPPSYKDIVNDESSADSKGKPQPSSLPAKADVLINVGDLA
ncbi:unnamed protein product [Tilletia controversa]|uniref:Uncharacterized protein n=3 Tax=Tilletia TaxID=13289 RepID=A0A8X7SXY9_9BASI|nr:hypothetical protein CF335_g5148 [Tilletia laevis]KAE8250071.1 hypothetical protein A4X06_0g2930 [Tilletia controversa]KAE8256905.1 hypothetical protein A4X03_0g4941 [Tilletia caries]CAD6884478.1 unnamed protein product [Tilletia caries]CAD6906441.1 unnamed protein product [Tilletia laevis]